MSEVESVTFKLTQTLHLLKSLIYVIIISNRGLFVYIILYILNFNLNLYILHYKAANYSCWIIS